MPSPEKSPPPAPGQRQRIMLGFMAALLVVSALLAAFALKKLPLSMRALIAVGDLAMALAIVLLMRKNPLRR